MNARSRRTVVVVGASRGLGRGAAEAFAASGADVVALARTAGALRDFETSHVGVVPVVGDATDPDLAAVVLSRYTPDVLVISAGAVPTMGSLDQQSWADFAVNWETDVKLTHLWLGATLRTPLTPGSRVIVISSGAALAGSPLSGGYAGAKATQRFLTNYAQDESHRRGLGITYSAVLPRITPLTAVGAAGTKAYANQQGISEAEYAAQFGEPLTPAGFGVAIRALSHMEPTEAEGSFLLTSAGLKPVA